MEKTIRTYSASQTEKLGVNIATKIKSGVLITLQGDLGLGKTTFTKGIAQGLGVIKTVNSPTFTISKIYQGRLPLIHMDAYRLEGIKQDLGFEEFFNDEWVSVVEWPQYIEDQLPNIRLAITIERIDDETRDFHFFTPVELDYLLEDIV